MRGKLLLAALALVCSLAAPSIGAAQTAYLAAGTTNIRSGPGTQYSVIARAGGGTPVRILGCVSGRSWCDSVVAGIRGWIAASRLQSAYVQPRIIVPQYRARYYDPYFYGGPGFRFEFGDRDGSRHYRRRDWRGDNDFRDFGDRRDGGRRNQGSGPESEIPCVPGDPLEVCP